MSSTVLGSKEVAAKLLALKSQTFRKVIEAVEKTAVRMANAARAGHEHGSDPHSRNRYENQTSNLTNSIGPGGANSQEMRFEKLNENVVTGLFGVDSTAPGSPLEYAPKVEELYPFIWPAAVANMGYFKQSIADCAPGAKGAVL